MASAQPFDKARFTASVARNVPDEATRRAIFDLLTFSENKALEVAGGQAQDGSFKYVAAFGARRVTLLTCDSRGYVKLSSGNFAGRPRELNRLREALANIPGFEYVSRYDQRPGFAIDRTLVNPHVMTQFQKAILTFQQAISAGYLKGGRMNVG